MINMALSEIGRRKLVVPKDRADIAAVRRTLSKSLAAPVHVVGILYPKLVMTGKKLK